MRPDSAEPKHRAPRGWIVALLALSVAACGEGPSTEAPGSSPHATLALSAEPLVRLGGEGQELYKVYAGVIGGESRLAVGNSSSGEVRFFDEGGRFLRASGRQGSGPGEFQGVHWVGLLPGDSLLVFDLYGQRFSVLGDDGRYARGFRNITPDGPGWPAGVFDDGSLLLAVGGQFDPRQHEGAVRDSLVLYRMSKEGEVGDRLGSFAGAEWLVVPDPASYRTAQLPFGRAGRVVAAGSRIYYNSSESGEIEVFSPSGVPTGIIDTGARPARLSAGEVAARLESDVADRTARGAIRRHMEADEDGMVGPAVSELRADPHGHVWIRTSAAAPRDSAAWLLYSPEGEPLGSVLLHARDLPLDVRDGVAMIRERDEEGVETVTLRRLEP